MNDTEGFLSIREEQLAELEVMKGLHAYCSKHGLKYILGYGSLLGAIRHHGFIPWDNDMDVFMPRKDMEKLIELEKTEPIAPNIKLFHMSMNENYHYPIVRACNMNTTVGNRELRNQIEGIGLWVDVFPMDGLIKSKLFFQKPLIIYYFKMLNATMYVSETESNAKKKFRRIVSKLFPNRKHKYERHLTSVCSWSRYEDAKKVSVICEEGSDMRWGMDREDVDNPVLTPFEDAEFYVPKNADKYLTQQYGNYMQLPREEDRQTHLLYTKYRN